MNKLESTLQKIKTSPASISFTEIIELVDSIYSFTPTAFKNGDTYNEVNQNNGSCKVFAFAQLNNLSKDQTLHLFGDYYRVDVIQNPKNDDHQNIRNFIKSGWEGIHFEGTALS